MDSGAVVLDISSDEEQDWSGSKCDDFDWISELLDDDDKHADDDSDDVVVVGEVNPKPKSKSSKQTLRDVDDDCVVLDGDPDKPVAVVDNASGGSDELLIVGEKGQIACRDYPHPRHLCASFPFSTTPHVKHCDLCHCYVCDSLAPCVNWGTGLSSVDHCHATEKVDTWKTQRRSFKLGKNATLTAPKVSDTSLSVSLPQVNQVPPLNVICLSPNPSQQNQVLKPVTIRACSSSNFSAPSIISQGRSQQSGFVFNKNRLQPQSRLISRQLLGPRNTFIRKSKFHHDDNLDRQFVSSHAMFNKRPGNVGVSSPLSHSIYSSSNKDACANARNPTTMTMSNDLNTIRWGDVCSSTNQSSSQLNLGSTVESSLPSQTQIYSQLLPSSHSSQDFDPHRNHVQNYDQSVCQYGNQCETAGQNFSPVSNQITSAVNVSFGDYNYGLLDNTSQGNQQAHVEHSQVQYTEPVYEPSVKGSNSEFIQSNNLSSVSLDIENWLMDDRSVPEGSDGSLASHQLNMFSSEPPVDAAGVLLFDFESFL
ncbi:hypothetical protein FNV43_RR23166 [Rhamnella rubrinervis]|uniref:Uncharacterized protein n=1 Tax=Rhamnella rubrinervis TaxID=2594499 RepID=A0A8K0GRT5_9ROSA|nr:hypothetical protein FNV43_RR23166 [Rhamnella rubrinervis]